MNRLRTLNRPLVLLAAVMLPLIVVAIVGILFDQREVIGVNPWFKPLKFAISTIIYSITLALLLSMMPGRRRLVSVGGTIVAVALAIELFIISGFAAVGESSHFNVSTPLHTVAWSIMASSITAVWVITLIVAIALFRANLGDRARTIAIRAGVVLALVGMGLAFLMTGSPTPGQLADYQGIVGAHTVGAEDGGPGLPLLGWSTVAGDLRAPHFIGMHALQALPLLVLALEALSTRLPRLDARVRARLVLLAAVTYGAALVLLTVQALLGQSIVQPSGGVLVAGILIAAVAIASVIGILVRGGGTPDEQPATEQRAVQLTE